MSLRTRIARRLGDQAGSGPPASAAPGAGAVDSSHAPPPGAAGHPRPATTYRLETPVICTLTAPARPALTPDPEDRYGSLIDPQNPPPSPLTPAEAEQIRGYLDAAQADATRAAYRADLADFAAWCGARGLASLPAEPTTVARYLVDRAASLKVATLTRRLSAIAQAHQARELDSPTSSLIVRKVFAGIRRAHGTDQRGKAPLLPDDLRAMLPHYGEGLGGLRDKALVLLGFAGALRRSELVGLDLADLQVRREGLVLLVRRSKTDQEGQGLQKGIPRGRDRALCPVRAVEDWVKAAGIAEGPLFRPVDRHGNVGAERLADFTVVRVVKRLAAAIGLDPAEYGGHSLRAGLATAAAAAGKDERDIMRQTGHKSVAMVRRYIRIGELFRGNAAEGLL